MFKSDAKKKIREIRNLELLVGLSELLITREIIEAPKFKFGMIKLGPHCASVSSILVFIALF